MRTLAFIVRPITDWVRAVARQEVEIAIRCSVTPEQSAARIRERLFVPAPDPAEADATSASPEPKQPAWSGMAPADSLVFATGALDLAAVRFQVWAIERSKRLTLLDAGRAAIKTPRDLVGILDERIFASGWVREDSTATRAVKVLLDYGDQAILAFGAQALMGERLDLCRIIGRGTFMIADYAKNQQVLRSGRMLAQGMSRQVYGPVMAAAWEARRSGDHPVRLSVEHSETLDWSSAPLAEAGIDALKMGGLNTDDWAKALLRQRVNHDA